MNRERVSCSISVDEIEPNVLIIKPFYLKDFDDNSIYEFKLPNIYATNGTFLKAQKIKYISKPSIMYASIDDIKNKLGDIDISDEVILYHLKEASRLVEVIVQKAYEKQNVHFSKEDLLILRDNVEELKNTHSLVWHFVIYKTCYEALSTLYICMVTKPEKVKEVLSDLSKEFQYNLSAIKDLLDRFKKDFEDILNRLMTFADPVFALRGRTAMPVDINLGAPYYRPNGMDGYNRLYNNFSSRFGRRF